MVRPSPVTRSPCPCDQRLGSARRMSKRAVRTRLNWDAAYIFDSNDDDIHIISPHFTVFNHISPVNRSATGYDFSNSKKTIILKYMKNNDRLLQPERLDR